MPGPMQGGRPPAPGAYPLPPGGFPPGRGPPPAGYGPPSAGPPPGGYGPPGQGPPPAGYGPPGQGPLRQEVLAPPGQPGPPAGYGPPPPGIGPNGRPGPPPQGRGYGGRPPRPSWTDASPSNWPSSRADQKILSGNSRLFALAFYTNRLVNAAFVTPQYTHVDVCLVM
ncbi:hypothetical protein CPB84DRAFT_1846486 [Gymnopilus junonius]|uniref:Uncharacterized protein n=1 Tax=Gymnopilus junonius TaxID=109634 RepID=A0A9P5NPB3_GYMJU|nr:hypothetical protein CPB84DRAFT_1846486 [Gymnopilus junonius]